MMSDKKGSKTRHSEDGLSGSTSHKKKPLQLVTEEFVPFLKSPALGETSALEIQDIKKELDEIKKLMTPEAASGLIEDGSEYNLEKINEKINDIDKKVAVLEDRTKKLDNIPTKDEIKNIISDVLDNKGLATKDFVKLEIEKGKNAQIRWTISIVLTIVTVASGIIIKVL